MLCTERRRAQEIEKKQGLLALADEADQVTEEADKIDDAILEIRPRAVAGVLAVFDYIIAGDRDFWPEEALAGLRDIVEREARR